MRSFIKSHRRNGSSISEELDFEHPPSINTYSTPSSSPTLQHSQQFSPPPRTIYNNSKSSPKKLLTPIKNLFSSSNHGSKNSSPIDQSKRLYKPKRSSHGSITALDIPRNMSFEKTRVVSSPMVKPTFSTSIPSLVSPFQETPQTSLVSVNKIAPVSDSLEIPTLKPAISFQEHARPQSSRENSWNGSTTSICDSKIDIKQVSFESPMYVENANSNSSDDLSETSSQFSFIKDRKGGKNTSVKYYKTPSKKEPESAFIAQDLGYDEEDLQDYDFESNGLYDEDDEEDVNYNNAFDDEEDVYNNNAFDDEEDSYYQEQYEDADDEDEINYNRGFDDSPDNPLVNVVKIAVDDADDDFTKDKDFDDDELNFNYSLHNVDEVDNKLTANGTNTQTSNSSPYSFGDYDRDLDEYSDGYDLGNIDDITYEQHEMIPSDHFNSLAYLAATSTHSNKFKLETQNTKATLKLPQIFDSLNVNSPKDKLQPFYLSFHGSIDGFNVSDVESDASNIYGDDILENYLDLSKLPSADPPSAHRGMQIRSQLGIDDITDSLYPVEIGSPLINGVTIGSNLNHRSQSRIFVNTPDLQTPTTNRSFIHRLEVDEHDYNSPARSLHLHELSMEASESCKFKYMTSFHSSVSDGLNLKIAQKIEEFDQFSDVRTKNVKLNDIPSPRKSKAARESIHQMMALLGSLEDSSTETKEASKENFNDNGEATNSKVRRLSILNMMDMLGNLEVGQAQDVLTTTEKIKENRKSILDMMSTLDSIGSTVSGHEVDAGSKRDSINFMMNALEQLNLISSDVSDTQAARIKQRNSQKAKKSTKKSRRLSTGKTDQNDKSKRYSWTYHDGSNNANSDHVVNEIKGTEDIQENLDEDIIDEINQLPEDFDFEEHESQWKLADNKQIPSFYRSNSYNKKPIREVRDNNYRSNKIQTLGKTVTFYKNKSLNVPTELAKLRSITRGASLRSNNSFACVSEEAEEE